MFRNFLLITLRNLRKNSLYSFINVTGLSIGLACSLLIMLWVADELSFDDFHSKKDRLYRLYTTAKIDGKLNTWGALPVPSYEALKDEDPRVLNTCIADWGSDHLFAVGDLRVKKRAYYISKEFLSMFDFKLIKGNPETALADPSSFVISESMARAIFGNEDPIDKVIKVDNRSEMKVSGVVEDAPENSYFQFDALLPWDKYLTVPWVSYVKDDWNNHSWQVFAELDDNASLAHVNDVIKDMEVRHGVKDPPHSEFLHPLADWRLYSEFEDGKVSGGRIEYVRLFSVIAGFILIIACINFMNLATARSERRAKEVGVRKSVGSRRYELIFQFIGESLMLALFAFTVALVISYLILPWYNMLVDKNLSMPLSNVTFWTLGLGLTFLTGILAGSYPAFYLSAFNPVAVLKGKFSAGKSGNVPRKVMVTVQFGFAIFLIVGTMVVYQQIQHARQRDIGFDKENLVWVNHNEDMRRSYKAIKNELLQTGVVVSVTKSNSQVTNRASWNFVNWPGNPTDNKVIFLTVATEYDYTKTMGIQVVEGRDFSEDHPSDTAAIMINQAAVDLMNLKEPIGTKLTFWDKQREIIGVVENSIMGSPNDQVEPMVITFVPDWVNVVSVRLEPTTDTQASLDKVQAVFRKYSPEHPIEYQFADQEYEKKFKDINTTGTLANTFSGLAILITGMGIFGLAAYTAAQRTKEIGIRKVMGATIPGLITLISRDFSRLVIVAFLIASPVAWWVINDHLQRYSDRITISWWIFPLTGLIALLFALTIVGAQAFKVARANPVKALRTE